MTSGTHLESPDADARVVVSGVGILSPLGNSPSEIWRRVRAGVNAETAVSGDAITPFEIPLERVPAERRTRLGRLDRYCRLFLVASHAALADAGLEPGDLDGDRLAICFGTGLGCLLADAEYAQKLHAHGPAGASPQLFAYTVSSAAAGEVAIALGARGPGTTIHSGLAAGTAAIGEGMDLLLSGRADVILAGGADACGPALLDAWRALIRAEVVRSSTECADPAGAQHAPAEAGLAALAADGAAVLVLERADRVAARRGRALAALCGQASGFIPAARRATSTGVEHSASEGSEVLAAALRDARVTADQVRLVVAGARGPVVDAAERAALQRALGPAADQVTIVRPALAWGETFGASGALCAALGIGGLAAVAPPGGPGVVLVSTLCYSGAFASLVLAGVA